MRCDKDCKPTCCSMEYRDYCSGRYLVDYDSDNEKDITLIEDSCTNSCQDCLCTDCEADCSAQLPPAAWSVSAELYAF